MKFTMLVLFLSLPVFGQDRPEGPPAARQFPAPKNLKILPPERLMETMQAFRLSLGVRCEFCHVQGNFASDEKPQKETARQMIAMARDINAKFFESKMRVTCFTCHHGAEEPASRPAAGAQAEHGEQAEHPHP
jgi:hypothetical protein